MGKRAALLPAAGHGRGAQLLPICPIARAGSCPQIAARTRKAHAALSFSLKRSEPLFLGLDQLLHQFADLPGLLLRDVDVLDHRALELDAVDCAAVLDEAQRQGAVQEVDDGGDAPADQHDHQACKEALGHHGPAHEQGQRSEEHTSELQSHSDLVCRLLLEKKKKTPTRLTKIRIKKAYSTIRWYTISDLSLSQIVCSHDVIVACEYQLRAVACRTQVECTS